MELNFGPDLNTAANTGAGLNWWSYLCFPDKNH